jgi:hypothetical protein
VHQGEVAGGQPPVRRSPERGGKPLERRDKPENREELAGLGREQGKGFFKKRVMGAPDSLKCLFGAHQTAHSSCPVNHRTAHRKGSCCARGGGAPDSAQCSVRCTPDCPVSPDRGKF